MPRSDWQFWVVTVVASIALGAVLRMVVPRRKKPTRTTLTVGGQRPAKKRGWRYPK